MDFEHFRNRLVSPALRAIADHWHEARGTAPMPRWDQLRPARMAPYLSIIWAYRYDASEDRFFGRLAGDNILRAALGKNFRGIAVDELWPDPARVHQKMLRMICEPSICMKRGNLFRHEGRLIAGERIALPLAADGQHGDGILGASDYRYPLRGLEMDRLELLDGDEEWFAVMKSSGDGPGLAA